MEKKIINSISQSLTIPGDLVEKVLKLLIEEECTIPFIARYRKEVTSGLDEVQIGNIQISYTEFVELEKRKIFVLEAIKKQEKLTPELEKKIIACDQISRLEDLYAPYKVKRKSKGQVAIEAGLKPLADILKTSSETIKQIEKTQGLQFINTAKKIENFDQALEGAQDIITEEISHDVDLKEVLRQDFWRSATLKTSKRAKADEIKESSKFKDYFEYEQKISDLKNPKIAHRFLAIRRASTLKILKTEVIFNEEEALNTIAGKLFNLSKLGCREIIEECIKRSYKVSIHSSLSLEIKTELKNLSDVSAIDVFGINLKNLLLQPYLGPKAVIGIDPGVRTGCKVAVIDKNGKFLADTVIYPHPPKNHTQEAKTIIETCIEQLNIEHIAIGNGTYGRETLQFLKQNIKQIKTGKVSAMLVNEDGASIYSASEIARNEFPDKDITVRGAISIARRFQDPLAELVKIDPKSIGVGQYQHDVNQVKLKNSLESVVENCVNYVGVDLNTASAPLLSFVSGITPAVASNVVKQREKLGGFKDRKELLKVGRFSEKVFEQSAGFLRIYNGPNPLDGTFIHPERYDVLTNWCRKKNIGLQDFVKDKEKINLFKKDSEIENEIGTFTHKDIVNSLLAPSQDPREEFVSFEYRNDISSIKDLKENEWYPGIVTNITQFGAFVDIGIKENGLIHVSQMADKFVENALEVLKVGQEVKARIIEIEYDRGRIALSLKTEGGKEVLKNSPPQNERNIPKSKEIKNNAFSGLKNFKIK